jgi:dsRNA-specific ribonuclease
VAGGGGPPVIDPQRAAVQREAVVQRLGELTRMAMEAIRTGRGRDFQRLELIGDSILELVLHAHSVIDGPGCPHCGGRADLFTTDAHLGELAEEIALGDWLDWSPSEHRLADLVEACGGAAWVSGGWSQVVDYVGDQLHPLAPDERRRLLHGGAQVHPEAPARAREILGAAILEAAASTGAYRRDPVGDEGDLSRVKARMLSSEHVLSRCRESRWVHRTLRTRRFDRDDVERELAANLLAHGIASAVTIAWPLTA